MDKEDIIVETLRQPVSVFFDEPPKPTDQTVYEAIEKSHPVSPKKTAYGGYHCPNCDRYVSLTYNYCINCGQHLKWEEE